MIIKIDIESKEFKEEYKKTEIFIDEVCKKYNFVQNPEKEINDSIKLGLTRTQMIYGEKYCPCFMVIGATKEELEKEDNRLCPCEPALKNEIPSMGHCHCAIFCTSQYANTVNASNSAIEISHSHSRGLTKKECEALLQKDHIDGEELGALIEARNIGFVDFLLVDTREWMEYKSKMIVGTDYLIPTTSFYNALSQIENYKESNIILYCFSGSRSAYCQHVMKQIGYKNVVNLEYGIMTYRGEITRGV